MHDARSKLKNDKETERQRKHEEKMEWLRKEKEIWEKGTLEVYDKISEKKRLKKQEEERLAKELKEIKLQRQYLNASKAMVEEKAWKDLENGAERIAWEKQNDALLD